jgi:hypothetical protein
MTGVGWRGVEYVREKVVFWVDSAKLVDTAGQS